MMGALVMCMILAVTRCEKYINPLSEDINPDALTENVDYKSIKTAGNAIESALLSTDQSTIDALVLDESLDLYKGKQVPYTTEELTAIGNAFKTRELTTATENFAEYSYTIDGKKYTMTLACEEEGTWKIIRY